MYFASAKSRKGKSYYTVKEYHDVADEDGNVKRKRVQTKVSFEGQAVDIAQSSQNSDASEDEGDHAFHNLEIPLVEDSTFTDHQRRKESNVRHWQELRSKLIKISLTTEGFPSRCVLCCRCGENAAIYRCTDCGNAALSMCKDCTDHVHKSENIFHCPEVWQDQEWKPYLLTKELINPFHGCTNNGKKKSMITVVDSKGRQHEVSITFCQCQTPGETLVCLRLWPATPWNPSLAFTWDLMTGLQSLMFECQVSVYDYVKHLNFYKSIFDKNRTIYRQLLDSFEEFRYHWKARENCSIDENNLTIMLNPLRCPACPTEADQFPGDTFMSADACFGLPRKKSRSRSYQEPLSSGMYFHPQSEVDTFMSLYPTSTKDQEEDCSDFQAGSVIRSKGRYIALDETAVFGIACKHSFPWKFVNVKGGERIGYMVYMMTKLLETNPKTKKVKIMYDICCQLTKHLKKQGRTDLLERFELGCPQFHAYAHGADCQIQYSPRRLSGWGLCDGEVMERLWSYLGRFKRMTKEMSSTHREDILNDALHFHALHQKDKIVLTLIQRHEYAFKRQNEAKDTLQDIQNMCSDTLSDDVLCKWQNEEREIIARKKPQTVNLGEHGWVTEYLQLLRTYYALRESVVLGEEEEISEKRLRRNVQELVKLEKTYGIKARWKASDQNFKSALITSEASKATTFLDLLRMCGRRRWFLLSLMKRYADGQKQSQRIIKAISRESKILQENLKKYNASVQVLREQGLDFKILTWEQASNASGDLYKQSSVGSNAQFSPMQAWRRDALETFALLQRTGEEMTIIKGEMSSVVVSLYADCRHLDSVISTIKARPLTTMLVGLLSIVQKNQGYHHNHLCFAVRSLSKYIDVPLYISEYIASISLSESFECAEEEGFDSEDEGSLQDSFESLKDATTCFIEKDYLFDEQASDSGIGTGC